MRIGLHAGPVMTGVVGRRKFTYDIWGDVVNVAQRMEAAGVPGRVNVSDAIYQRTRHLFDFEPRGPVEVAKKGPLEMYFLERIKPAFSADAAGRQPNDAFARARRGSSLAAGR
jgi:class 3 adenylate cyclase